MTLVVHDTDSDAGDADDAGASNDGDLPVSDDCCCCCTNTVAMSCELPALFSATHLYAPVSAG